ncbi:sigma factor [Bacillus massiliglaciei]|uniref:sigma factor n=1 Tax=Bacillus massiliglaciei TaxID=1816693 RepID=UPI001F2A67C9|nr:sigma factor [Bacillus massiliglaciei]
MGEKERIQRAQSGDDSDLAMLLRDNYAFLLKYIIKLTYKSSEAEDLAQETMAKAISNI